MNLRGPKSRGGPTASLMVYVDDVDAMFARARRGGRRRSSATSRTSSGATAPARWSTRYGHRWMLATHVEEVPPEEMERRMAEGSKQPRREAARHAPRRLTGTAARERVDTADAATPRRPSAADQRGLNTRKYWFGRKRVLGRERVARGLHLGLHVARGDARRRRRTDRRLLREVDDRDRAARLQRARELAEVRGALVDVVVDVDQQDEVDLLGQVRIGRRALHRRPGSSAGLLRALAEVADHVGLDVDGVDAALRHHVARRTAK